MCFFLGFLRKTQKSRNTSHSHSTMLRLGLPRNPLEASTTQPKACFLSSGVPRILKKLIQHIRSGFSFRILEKSRSVKSFRILVHNTQTTRSEYSFRKLVPNTLKTHSEYSFKQLVQNIENNSFIILVRNTLS